MHPFIKKMMTLSLILTKEQVKEPIAFIWIILSPSLMFYFLCLTKGIESFANSNYFEHSAFFYAYVSASVAFFGYAFYLIGRRESGFIRSFAYQPRAKALLLCAQLLTYTFIALLYCTLLYLLTRPLFGGYEPAEFLFLLLRFCTCFLMFCVVGLLVVRLPLTFQNANTVFSALLFLMLMGLFASRMFALPGLNIISYINPLVFASDIMVMQGWRYLAVTLGTVICLIALMWASIHWIPVNPIWSRY